MDKIDVRDLRLVEKEKKVTYEDIAKELFANKKAFYITTHGISEGSIIECFVKDSNNCTSRKQAEKLLAINRLMNVAKYLNKDWQPDWDYRHEKKYYIHVEDEQVKIYYVYTVQCGDVYFKSEELAKQAIEILGKETIKLALCSDY